MEAVTYKCPNCGAPLAFDIKKQGWACAFCSSEFERVELSEQLGETAKTGEYDSEQATVYSCPSCGGRVITAKNTAATFCMYCHSPAIIAGHLSGEYRPAYIVPFRVEKAEAIEALQKLCRRRPLLPKAFRGYVEKGEVGGLYVPFWLYSAEIHGNLQANGRRVTSWTSGNVRFTKTDTYHIHREASMSFAKIPSDGSSKMDDALMESLEPFDYAQIKAFDMGYLSGHFAESYDVEQGQATPRAMLRMKDATREMLCSLIDGYSSYDLTSLDARQSKVEIAYAMLPVWTVMTEYNGKRYLFAMNGQTGKITGHLPVSWGHFWTIAAGLFAFIGSLAVAGGFLL